MRFWFYTDAAHSSYVRVSGVCIIVFRFGVFVNRTEKWHEIFIKTVTFHSSRYLWIHHWIFVNSEMLKGSIRRQDKAVLKVMSQFCNLHVVSVRRCKMNDGAGNLGIQGHIVHVATLILGYSCTQSVWPASLQTVGQVHLNDVLNETFQMLVPHYWHGLHHFAVHLTGYWWNICCLLQPHTVFGLHITQCSFTILNFGENTYGKIGVLYLGKYVAHLIISRCFISASNLEDKN